ELYTCYLQCGFALKVQDIQHECFRTFFYQDKRNSKSNLHENKLKQEACDKSWIVLIELRHYEDTRHVNDGFKNRVRFSARLECHFVSLFLMNLLLITNIASQLKTYSAVERLVGILSQHCFIKSTSGSGAYWT